ncbi:MAG: sigma-70 family RNA polymerase sigma factor [Bacteroidia bacterium]|nr:sigma-70 family RNA polymerase sigma factor [Bacteroidia bacterium]
MKDSHIIDLLKSNRYAKVSEKLYGYFPVIKKLILKNSGNREDAEDIYQEALIILIKKIKDPSFELRSSLNTYLYSICRFLWSERLKKKNKKPETGFEKYRDGFQVNELETFQKNESDIRLAEKAFQQLGEKCKQLLMLFYFKKMTMANIAQKLNFNSENVAKNQKYRCIEKAKENLQILKSSSHE